MFDTSRALMMMYGIVTNGSGFFYNRGSFTLPLIFFLFINIFVLLPPVLSSTPALSLVYSLALSLSHPRVSYVRCLLISIKRYFKLLTSCNNQVNIPQTHSYTSCIHHTSIHIFRLDVTYHTESNVTRLLRSSVNYRLNSQNKQIRKIFRQFGLISARGHIESRTVRKFRFHLDGNGAHSGCVKSK